MLHARGRGGWMVQVLSYCRVQTPKLPPDTLLTSPQNDLILYIDVYLDYFRFRRRVELGVKFCSHEKKNHPSLENFPLCLTCFVPLKYMFLFSKLKIITPKG